MLDVTQVRTKHLGMQLDPHVANPGLQIHRHLSEANDVLSSAMVGKPGSEGVRLHLSKQERFGKKLISPNTFSVTE